MDRVRFGRALGQGTRAAARALVQAADAATSPNPSAAPSNASNPNSTQTRNPVPPPSAEPRRVAAQVRHQVQIKQAGVRAGSRNFIQATMAPVKKASGILWLEVTGALFALVAFSGALEVIRFRKALFTTGEDHRNLLLAGGIFLVFASCAASNFLRASRRSRT